MGTPLFLDRFHMTTAAPSAAQGSRARFASPNASESPVDANSQDYVSLDGSLQRALSRFAPAGVNLGEVVWFNVFFLVVMHIVALYGLWVALTAAKWATVAFAVALWPITGMGITVGVHRLWSHRSYKAHWTLRLFLAMINSAAYQGSIFEWSRDHRVHHKCSETDGDPYNAARGMFFAHIGWIMVRKHPEVIRQGRKIDVSDLLADPIVVFQAKYYLATVMVFCYVVPTAVCWCVFGDSIVNGLLVAGVLRHMIVLHTTWTVNSLAHNHNHGMRPYNEKIHPAENWAVVFGAIGEGWHNYHHMFAYDYSASEFGWATQFNPSTAFIDSMAALGLVWERRKASPELVSKHKAEVLERTESKPHQH
eukprot:Amastigsp_a54_15494.p1 type:complete len:365 gc:universal Amastigsp_a54_15494:1-1095(+)